jgi:hypothetical protein
MLETIIIATAAFTAGLVYGKGKTNPVQSALEDAGKIAGKGMQTAAALIRSARQTWGKTDVH